MVFLSGGTNGPTAAGGAVHETTLARARREGLAPLSCLKNNDADPLLQQVRSHLVTGPILRNAGTSSASW